MPIRTPSSLPKLGSSCGHKKAIAQANAKVRRFFVEPSSPPRFTERELETILESLDDAIQYVSQESQGCLRANGTIWDKKRHEQLRRLVGRYHRLLAKLQREGKGKK